ncbi:MAG: hypothetical protein WBG92_05055 [Thiohalocapsa sp.]
MRGIAYKLFTLGLIADMSKNQTARVSRLLTDARESGMIPWEWIVDETREAERITAWSSPDEIIAAAVNGYRRDYWQEQPNWIEVWSEKGTVRGVLRPILDRYGLTFRVMHGFGSATAINEIAAETREAGRTLHVRYVGDWDPSGMYMSESDLPARVGRYGGACQIERVALSAADVGEASRLPSFDLSTKTKDPRSKWFAEHYGTQCWELDALDPNSLRNRVEASVLSLLDVPAWNHALDIEAAEKESMQLFHRHWRESISRQVPKYEGDA